MLENILKTNGAEQLSKQEQLTISGGTSKKPKRCQSHLCPDGFCCGSNPYLCELAEADGSNCR